MGAVDNGLTAHDFVKLLHDKLFRVRIQVARSFIKEEDLCLRFEKTTSDKDTLAFASRKFGTKVTDLSLVAVLHAHNAIVDAALASDSFDVFLRRIWVAISQVVLDRVVEKDTILRHYDDMLSERLKRQVFHILVVYQHFAIDRVVNSKKQVQHGGLSEAGRSNDGISGASFNFKVKVLEEVLHFFLFNSCFIVFFSIRASV